MIARLLLLLAAGALAAGACSLEAERQWYKPGASYTVADFRRDEDACRRNRQLDEECLKQRGWVPLSPDRQPKAKSLEEQERDRKLGNPSGGRY